MACQLWICAGRGSLPRGTGEQAYGSVFLPFWGELCFDGASVWRISLCAVAQFDDGAVLGDGAGDRGAGERLCFFPGDADRRYFPSVRRRGGTVLCRQIL